jgi:uncharacterized protein
MDLYKNEIIKIIIPYLKKNGVLKASLFGSFVRNESENTSDIDLIVQFKKGKSLLDLVGLQIELQEELKRKIDIVTYNSLHHKLRDQILSEHEVFYEEKS